MDIKEQILVALGLNKAEEEIKLAWQAKSEDGTIFVSTAEELEAGVDISVLTAQLLKLLNLKLKKKKKLQKK